MFCGQLLLLLLFWLWTMNFWLCTQKIESEEDNQGASNQQQAC